MRALLEMKFVKGRHKLCKRLPRQQLEYLFLNLEGGKKNPLTKIKQSQNRLIYKIKQSQNRLIYKIKQCQNCLIYKIKQSHNILKYKITCKKTQNILINKIKQSQLKKLHQPL